MTHDTSTQDPHAYFDPPHHDPALSHHHGSTSHHHNASSLHHDPPAHHHNPLLGHHPHQHQHEHDPPADPPNSDSPPSNLPFSYNTFHNQDTVGNTRNQGTALQHSPHGIVVCWLLLGVLFISALITSFVIWLCIWRRVGTDFRTEVKGDGWVIERYGIQWVRNRRTYGRTTDWWVRMNSRNKMTLCVNKDLLWESCSRFEMINGPFGSHRLLRRSKNLRKCAHYHWQQSLRVGGK